ncbi:hypothetical protein AVEN_95329-1 [Araneus ventricosus]|uniref:Uncharacterized protein n=1 Tax=Araneus ventricosus TaxID=182803 RepID=A0A4Y2WKJ9_ARAVE|nr:hypothetical protein AVEN_95329-1 [Araneus ventricosus]
MFWGGPRNSEPRSDDEDGAWAIAPSPSFRITPPRGRLALYVWIGGWQAQYRADVQWNRVSNLESSCPRADTLPLVNRGLQSFLGKLIFECVGTSEMGRSQTKLK